MTIRKIKAEIKQLSSMSGKLGQTEKMAIEALQNTKAAHKRMDELSKDLAELEKRIAEDKKQSKDDKKWLNSTVIGVISLGWNLLKHFLESISGNEWIQNVYCEIQKGCRGVNESRV
ncbi:hypothetical protein ACI7RC_18255 [Brevibacillus sp. B_LB10_24]|uniref:hypothetical protein n=1 Tax=Brevibacillus sp. B_LB10_24 TaxID=3380645 RepID=UPI0038BB6BF3